MIFAGAAYRRTVLGREYDFDFFHRPTAGPPTEEVVWWDADAATGDMPVPAQPPVTRAQQVRHAMFHVTASFCVTSLVALGGYYAWQATQQVAHQFRPGVRITVTAPARVHTRTVHAAASFVPVYAPAQTAPLAPRVQPPAPTPGTVPPAATAQPVQAAQPATRAATAVPAPAATRPVPAATSPAAPAPSVTPAPSVSDTAAPTSSPVPPAPSEPGTATG
jgi:hypothetical protein